jgi:TonB family protein
MRIVTTAKPRYPERLREAGIEGTVVVRFTVDTTGRVGSANRTSRVVDARLV